MKNYINAKKKIFQNQNKKDYCILNYDDPVLRRIAGKCPSKVVFFSRRAFLKEGACFSGNEIKINIGKTNFTLKGPFKIPGMHNIENIMAAAAMASCAGIKPEAIKKTVSEFSGVEHRIEYVAEVNGVKYFNDSKGTNVDSTRVALEAFNKNIWLILGGRDKGSSYKPLSGLIRKKVKGVLLIGEASRKISRDLKRSSEFFFCKTLRNAVKKAYQSAVKGDTVLLSPACASFDQFKDYEDRGRQFKKLVNALRGK
jgi:UDP-N-acetylmuramoylalanine--D-glutamate ligase